MMVGVNISDEQLGSIADRTIQEADANGDLCISFSEFVKVTQHRSQAYTLKTAGQEEARVAFKVKMLERGSIKRKSLSVLLLHRDSVFHFL